MNPLANVLDLGPVPYGTGGSSPPPPTGTDYLAHDHIAIIGLSHQFIDFGFVPQGSGGVTTVNVHSGVRRLQDARKAQEAHWAEVARKQAAQLRSADQTELREELERRALEEARRVAPEPAAGDTVAVPVPPGTVAELLDQSLRVVEMAQAAAEIERIEIDRKRSNEEAALIVLMMLA